MCGIAGFWNFRTGRPADLGVIQAMTRTLTHRGPDDEGYRVEGSLALGARRLRVVDLPGGSQPMPNEDATIQVVFNGEIYNHRELRGELEGRGHRFRTRSDTEVIAHAFEAWGPACVERMNGMFAIAVWDGRARRLFLARDRLGIKPLHVWEGPEGVAFGSELKAVLAAPWVPLEWDLGAVDDFMTYEYVPCPGSIVRGIEKVPPATWLLFDEARAGARETRRFWQLEADAHPRPASVDRAAEEIRGRLRVSVRRRLMADVPLGAFLSGGIDSSAIVGLMAAEPGSSVRTFSLGFEDRSYDELDHARTVADHFGTLHREERITPRVLELADEVLHAFDEPFADVSAFPTLLVSRLARAEVTVALSGDGGDELFAGYDHYRADRWARRLRWLSERRGWRLVDRLLDRVPPAPSKKGAVNLAKRFTEGLRRPADLEHARWWVFWDLAERRELYEPDFLSRLEGRDCFAAYRSRLREGADRGFTGLGRQLYADVVGYLPDDILTKVDRASMATSLEARVPFLDHELVESAMAIPAEWKLRGGRTKWILRRALRDLLPRSILRRGKEGFSIPLKNWIRGPLRPLVADALAPERVHARGWFDAGEVARLIAEHDAGRANHAHRLWCLITLERALRSLEARRRPPADDADPRARELPLVRATRRRDA